MYTPADAMVRINPSYYKIGRFGFVYIWSGDSWLRSTKTKENLKQEISSQARRKIAEKKRDESLMEFKREELEKKNAKLLQRKQDMDREAEEIRKERELIDKEEKEIIKKNNDLLKSLMDENYA